jgi:hypothetical protein
MADIQQWRRMIQPTRARTPAALDNDDLDPATNPLTPRRGLKPKISSYFTSHGAGISAAKAEPSISAFHEDVFDPKMPSWAADDPFPQPQAEGLIDSIMCRLLSKPYEPLEPRFNGMLLQIFESFRNLNDQTEQIRLQMEDEVARSRLLEKRLQDASKQWSEERQDFKAEVKRLELLLAKGKRGLAEVTRARQDSIIRQKDANRRSRMEDDGLKTIFDFLERTGRNDERAWGNQRGTSCVQKHSTPAYLQIAAVFRVRPVSPSAREKRLSQQLLSNAHADLPFGTPPDVRPSTLAEATLLEERAAYDVQCSTVGLKSVSEPKTSMSDDTFSTFSCVEDLLPGEAPAVSADEALEDDFIAIQRIANALARRRNIDSAIVMPKLFDLFGVGGPQMPTPKSTKSIQKQPSLISKASGFFNRLKGPQPADASGLASRSFSFEAGDDVVPIGAPVLSESRRSSKIPAPQTSIARPRQEREDSSSSLLTAVASDMNDRSESRYGYKSMRIVESHDENARDSSSNRLLDYNMDHGFSASDTSWRLEYGRRNWARPVPKNHDESKEVRSNRVLDRTNELHSDPISTRHSSTSPPASLHQQRGFVSTPARSFSTQALRSNAASTAASVSSPPEGLPEQRSFRNSSTGSLSTLSESISHGVGSSYARTAASNSFMMPSVPRDRPLTGRRNRPRAIDGPLEGWPCSSK